MIIAAVVGFQVMVLFLGIVCVLIALDQPIHGNEDDQ